MNDVPAATDTQAELYEIEQIKNLLARFYLYGDTQQWDEFAALLTDDVEIIIDAAPRPNPDADGAVRIVGRDAFIGGMQQLVDGVKTAHQLYLPNITIIDEAHAKGIWAMHDYVKTPVVIFNGWGHLHHEYRKVDGEWKISKGHTTRLIVDEEWL